jgi:ABC-type transporter Mla subunit MlaD
MRVTRPRLWLALVTIVGLVAAGIFWTIFTRIPSTAATTGSPVASGSRTHPARPKNPPA